MNILRRAAFRVGLALTRSGVIGSSWLDSIRAMQDVPDRFSPKHAASLPAVGAAVRGISKRVARLPMTVHRMEPDGTLGDIDATSPLAHLVTRRWSTYTTRQDGLMHFMRSVLLYGKGGVWIERTPSGIPVALHPVNPEGLVRTQAGMERLFQIQVGANVQQVDRQDLIFLPFFPPTDGVTDVSPLAEHWPAIRAALMPTSWASWFFKKGATPTLLYTTEVGGGDTKRTNRELWEVENIMREKNHRSMVAPGGYKAQDVGSNARDAEVNESREFGVQETSRIYDYPPPFLQDFSRATYQNIQGAREELAETVTGWTDRVAAEFSNIVWPEGDYAVAFDTSTLGLERFSVRMRAYRDAREAGVLTPNESRRIEGYEDSDQEGANDLLLSDRQRVMIEAMGAEA